MKGARIHPAKVGTHVEDNARETPAYDLGLLRRLWPYVRPHRGLLLFALVMIPVSSALHLAGPYLMKLAIDQAIVPGDLGRLGPLVALLVGAMLLERLAQFGEMLAMQYCGQRAMHGLRTSAQRHLLSLRTAFFDRTPVGTLMTRVTNDVESITEAFNMGLVSVVGDLLTLIGIAAVMLWLSPKLALITLAAMPLLVLVVELYRRLLRAAHRLIRRRIAQINATLQEQITGMNVIQIFGQQRRAMADFDRANRAHRDAYRDAIRYDASLFALVEMFSSVTVALLLWYGGMRVIDDAITIGLLVAFVEYVQRFFIPIRDLSAKYTVMQQAMAASERVFGLLDVDEVEPGAQPPARVQDGDGAASKQTDQEEKPRGFVEFQKVTFGYAPDRPVLRGIDFAVARGESVALVGATGAGKTTLIRLLTRLYELDSGQILLDGRPIRRIAPSELRRRVVVVSQDVFMFAGTVAENISLGDPRISREAVERAARRVGLDRLLDLDREVLEQGSNLSAGERQLVAFARALVREPEVLVLDEATSSVDPESEALIQQGIAELMQRRTFLVIAHRLSTIERVGRILVFQGGEVREEGSHAELLAQGGLYARLHRLQYVAGAGPQGGAPGDSQ